MKLKSENLTVWQKSMPCAEDIYQLTRNFSKEEICDFSFNFMNTAFKRKIK